MSHENPKKQSQFQMWMKSSHESWMNESEMETLQLHSFATHNCLVEFIFWLGIKLNVLLSHFQVLKNKLWGWPWPKWGVIYHVWLKRNNKRNGEIIWIQRKLVHENFYKECRLFLLFPEEKNQRMQIFLGIDPLGNGSLWQSVAVCGSLKFSELTHLKCQ